jgi:hypothetical protein
VSAVKPTRGDPLEPQNKERFKMRNFNELTKNEAANMMADIALLVFTTKAKVRERIALPHADRTAIDATQKKILADQINQYSDTHNMSKNILIAQANIVIESPVLSIFCAGMSQQELVDMYLDACPNELYNEDGTCKAANEAPLNTEPFSTGGMDFDTICN